MIGAGRQTVLRRHTRIVALIGYQSQRTLRHQKLITIGATDQWKNSTILSLSAILRQYAATFTMLSL
ncbi:hypothetical protein CK216_01180 [Mesorhizobium sp. WSM3876]|nr:hypothetical protein CK216_01180 [Mesorhizobium sp. WSM3876]